MLHGMIDDATKKPKTAPHSREDRLAAALRANLNRRKQLARAKKSREDADPAPESDEEAVKRQPK